MTIAVQEAIKVLDLKQITRTSVVVIQMEPTAKAREELDPLLKRLPTDCLVILMKPGNSIQSYSRKRMNMFGWFDAEQITAAAKGIVERIETALAEVFPGREPNFIGKTRASVAPVNELLKLCGDSQVEFDDRPPEPLAPTPKPVKVLQPAGGK